MNCVRCKKPAAFGSKAHCAGKGCTWLECENCHAIYDHTTSTGFKFEGKDKVWHTSNRNQ